MELTITTLAIFAIVALLGVSVAVDIIIPATAKGPVGGCASMIKNSSAVV
jgi:hypothetical protein